MGFQIACGTPVMGWVAVDNADRSSWETLRIGQLVKSGSDGVVNLGAAVGAADTTTKAIPYGVVVGTNKKIPVFDSTYNTESITAADPHAAGAEDYALSGGSGLAPVGDTSAYVLVAQINPSTILRGRIFNGAYGVPITEGIVTTGSTTGAGFTCAGGLSDASTPVADLGTVHCRAGANRGISRITTDTSATVKTVGRYFPKDIAVGDKFVNVQMREWGLSYVQTDAEAMFFDAAANPATNYWVINVIKLDLSVPGDEYVLFNFTGDHFSLARA